MSTVADRVEALAYAYEAEPKSDVTACNLCGGDELAVVAERDRYGFPARSVACVRCGLVFLSPRLTAAAYADFYDHVYRPLVSAFHGRRIDAETVEADQQPYAARLAGVLEPFAPEVAGGTILDVGGSTGLVSAEVGARLGLDAVVLDPAPAEVGRARARGLDGVVGTIEEWEPGGRRFELVLLCQTVDHLLDVSGSLARLRALLADGGLLYVDVVDFDVARSRAGGVEGATKIDHPYSLTDATARAFLARAGLEPALVDREPDGLHVGYLCRTATPQPSALPDPAAVAEMLAELGVRR